MEFATSYMKTPEEFAPAPAWVEVDRVTVCRTTGFLATGNCPAVTIYMPTGKAPTSKCPAHGGDYNAASADPNAPRLFLIDQDGDVGSDTIPNEIDHQPTGPTYVPPSNIPDDSVTPYRHDPSPADVIEDRYQKLLKQYGIDQK